MELTHNASPGAPLSSCVSSQGCGIAKALPAATQACTKSTPSNSSPRLKNLDENSACRPQTFVFSSCATALTQGVHPPHAWHSNRCAANPAVLNQGKTVVSKEMQMDRQTWSSPQSRAAGHRRGQAQRKRDKFLNYSRQLLTLLQHFN